MGNRHCAPAFDKLRKANKLPKHNSPFNTQPDIETRIVFIGQIGAGKSTLIKMSGADCNLPDAALFIELLYKSVTQHIFNGIASAIDTLEVLESQEKLSDSARASCADLRKMISKYAETDIYMLEASAENFQKAQEAWEIFQEFAFDARLEHLFTIYPQYLQGKEDLNLIDFASLRLRTTGICENWAARDKFPSIPSSVEIPGDKICMVDVGGPRNERKKWIHCFQNSSMFIIAFDLSVFCNVHSYEDNIEEQIRGTADFLSRISAFSVDSDCFIFFTHMDKFVREFELYSEAQEWLYKGECIPAHLVFALDLLLSERWIVARDLFIHTESPYDVLNNIVNEIVKATEEQISKEEDPKSCADIGFYTMNALDRHQVEQCISSAITFNCLTNRDYQSKEEIENFINPESAFEYTSHTTKSFNYYTMIPRYFVKKQKKSARK